MIKYFTVIMAVLVCLSTPQCGQRQNADKLELALDLAGENRSQMEAVLEHYVSDSVKYEAAKYLIQNAPYNYAYHGWQIDSIAVADSLFRVTGQYDRSRFYYLFPLDYSQLEVVPDIKVLTKEFLIENIEYAFKAWQESSWQGQVPFEIFKKYILPYRTGTEPLTPWRKHYYDKYVNAVDSLYDGHSVLVAGYLVEGYINSLGWKYNEELALSSKNAFVLDRFRLGMCVEISDFHQSIMRSVGIPAVREFYLYSPNIKLPHSWTTVIDSMGQPWMVPYKRGDGALRISNGGKYGKIYRHSFEGNYAEIISKQDKKDIPPMLRNVKMTDVSGEYFSSNSIEIDFNGSQNKTGYLGVFTLYGWDAVALSPIVDGRATFKNIDREVLFIPLLFENGAYSYFGQPFIVDKDDRVVTFQQSGVLDSIRLNRKYLTKNDILGYMNRMQTGRFQGANRADFSDAVTLYRIDHQMVRAYFDVKVDCSQKFKFVRYISGKNRFGDIGSLVFFDKNGRKIEGKLSSSKPYEVKSRAQNAVDDDPLTYFSSSESEGWVALELDAPSEIGAIRYSSRHDDNFIRVGDVYELSFFGNGKWKSLGRITASDTVLHYQNTPANCLYLLNNLSRGVEIRPFRYKEGRQIFY